MDMDHVGEFVESSMLTHQDRDFLDNVSRMGTIGVTAENKTVIQTTPPFGHPSSLGFAALPCKELRRGNE